MDSITRRQLIRSGTALAGTAAAVKAANNAAKTGRNDYLLLECKWIEKTIDGVRVKLRSYNGKVPGELIKARPGETLRIRVKNSLPPCDSKGWDGSHNVPHMFNSTNLHLHGLDVLPHLFEPVGTGNPLAKMIDVMPGQSYDYQFHIPEDQPPGLAWYHPHHHGSTAVQAVSGMAGPLITYGDIDEVPEIKAARDIVLAIQDIGLFPSEDDPGLWIYEPKQNAMWNTLTGVVTMYNPKTGKTDDTKLQGGFTAGDYKLRYYMLNGEPFFKETHNYAPNQGTHPIGKQLPVQRFVIAPGEVVRFRMLNACSDNYMPIVVEQHDMHLIAIDSVNFEETKTIPARSAKQAPVMLLTPNKADRGQVAIPPAGRAEFLIQGISKPGVYRIVQLEQRQQFLQSDQKIIAEIEIKGEPKSMGIPKKLPVQRRYYPKIKPEEIKRVRNFVFSGIFPPVENPYVGIDFLINNNVYDELAVPHVVQVETAEEWHIQVLGAHHGGTEGHPFHVHVNHFEVISVDGKPVDYATVADTVWVPLKSTVVIRMKFKEFTGKSVFHCHILPHEDTGMMENFLIV
ncbi:MAG: multicopper oxidase family protein [Candidatus Sulfotelmatobacter sp.]